VYYEHFKFHKVVAYLRLLVLDLLHLVPFDILQLELSTIQYLQLWHYR